MEKDKFRRARVQGWNSQDFEAVSIDRQLRNLAGWGVAHADRVILWNPGSVEASVIACVASTYAGTELFDQVARSVQALRLAAASNLQDIVS